MQLSAVLDQTLMVMYLKVVYFGMHYESAELSLLIRAGNFWRVSSEVGPEGGWLKAKVVNKDDQLLRLEVENL